MCQWKQAGVMQTQGKECQQLLEAGRERTDPLPEPLERPAPPTLWF